MTKSKKKCIAILTTMTVLICGLLGCGNSSADSVGSAGQNVTEASEAENTAGTKTEEPTKITYFVSRAESDDVVQSIKELAEQYIAEGHNIEFIIETAADEATYSQKLRAMATADELPTLFDLDPVDLMREMASNDMLVDMQAFLDDKGLTDLFVPMALNYGRLDDNSLYSIPFEMSIEMIWYNVDMFEDCGLTAPETFNDFINCCKVLKENGYTPISITGVDSWCLMRYLGNVPFRRTGNDYVKGLADGTNKMSDEVGMQALEFIAEVGQYFQEGFVSCDYSTAQNMFLEGKTAIYEMGSWELNNFIPAVDNGMNFDYFYMPSCEGAVTNANEYWAFGGIGMCADKKQFNEDVEDFLVYLIQNYGKLYTSKQHFAPMEVDVAELEEEGYTFHELFYRMLEDLENIGERSARPWDVVLPSTVTTIISDNLNSVAMGNISPEEMAAMIDEGLEKALQ